MSLQADLAWLRAHTPLTREAAERLAGEDWVAHTFCLAIHLDLKMIPVIEPLLQTGARILLLGANPATTRDEVVEWLGATGAEVRAARDMDDEARLRAMDWAITERPTFLSEMGGEVTVRPRHRAALAGGAMFNLAAGPGDPFDAFDLTSAIMLEGIRFMVRRHLDFPPGIHLFPAEVERAVVANSQ